MAVVRSGPDVRLCRRALRHKALALGAHRRAAVERVRLDGHVVRTMPIEAIKAQSPPTVPILMGTNKDEATIFLPLLLSSRCLATRRR